MEVNSPMNYTRIQLKPVDLSCSNLGQVWQSVKKEGTENVYYFHSALKDQNGEGWNYRLYGGYEGSSRPYPYIHRCDACLDRYWALEGPGGNSFLVFINQYTLAAISANSTYVGQLDMRKPNMEDQNQWFRLIEC
jgi:hypothetical protein